jgi:molybdopterin converting factor subunit 1
MIVRVRLFAAPRELAGTAEVEVELPEGSTVADLRMALARQIPVLAPVLPHARFALAADFAAETARVPAGAEVACIPPVSGG